MKKLILALCLTSLLVPARAEQSAPPPTVELKQKSTFEAKNVRNPFWPIGFVKPGPANAGDSPAAVPAILPSAFVLTSVTMGANTDGRFAILNGKVMQEGQQFGLQMGAQVYQVTVQAIEDGQIILAYQGGQVVVPLRRR